MAPPLPGSFAHVLKQRRARLDLTQEALAELMGCAVYTIRTYEMGTRRPSHALAERLADVLALAPDERRPFLALARAPLPAAPAGAGPAEPPAEPEAARPARLPAPPNALIGRSSELDALRARLAEPGCRLLTILGPGGVGKTRLALQLAADLARDPGCADEIVWVELAPLLTAAQLPTAIAASLGAPAAGAADPAAHLLAALGRRRAVLFLDNAEHLLEGAGLLAAILREAPAARLVVTSRERLRVRGEWVFELDGLALHPAGHSGQAAAALLFLERARQVDPAFALDAANQGAVAAICRQLEGLPLGIELAAAWVRVLPCAAIADELTCGLDFLARADRDAPPAQRSLRAVFEHSWALLGGAERALLERLAVFRGGWDRAAAAAVADASVAGLAALVDASLARRAPSGGDVRYSLHELVRQYAAEHLQRDPAAAAAVAARHAAHFARALADQLPALQSGAQPAALARLRPDLDNVRAAWAWATLHRDQALLHAMGRSIMTLCEDLGWLQEGAQLFGAAADALEAGGASAGADSVILGRLRGRHGYFLARCGRLGEARRRLAEAARTLAGDAEGRGQVLTHQALVSYQRGSYDEALGNALAALAALRPLDDVFYMGLAACFAGMAALAHGDLAGAAAHLDESVALWRRNGYPRGMLLAASALGGLALARGDLGAAEAHAAHCVRLAAAQRDRWGMALALATLGRAALERGDLPEAAYLYREAGELARELGEQWVACLALVGGGRAALASGEGALARQAFQEAAALGVAAGFLPAALEALLGLAHPLLGADEELALLLLAVVCRHPATDAAVRARAERQWRLASAALDEQRAALLWAAAATQPLDALVARLERGAIAPAPGEGAVDEG